MATRGKKEKEYPPMPANWMYKRGDVYMMDLNPYSGSEQGGIRPAIVVQNDDGNFYSNVLLVVPLTTQIKKRNMPTHFILHNRFLSAPSMAICESPRPADKSRVLSYLGHLSKYEMRQVSVCLQYSFGFIGYKSFRKYLTAPPQEDVLAAAKELLSKQFQNLRVLNSQPPAQCYVDRLLYAWREQGADCSAHEDSETAGRAALLQRREHPPAEEP